MPHHELGRSPRPFNAVYLLGSTSSLTTSVRHPQAPTSRKEIRRLHPEKLAGDAPILRHLPENFPMPNSRHTEVQRKDIERHPLHIVAESEESGVGIVTSADGTQQIFIVGHLEYEPKTLHNEYQRDLSKGLPIAPPLHYYHHDKPQEGIDFSWKKRPPRSIATGLTSVAKRPCASSENRNHQTMNKKHRCRKNTKTDSTAFLLPPKHENPQFYS